LICDAVTAQLGATFSDLSVATCDGHCGSLILRFTFAAKTKSAAITAAEDAINADPSVVEVTVDGVNGGNPIAPNNVDASNTFNPTPAPTTLPSSSPSIYIECRLDQYVKAGVCVPCPLGTTNTAGDMAAGGDTACDPIECRLDQYVNAGVCVTCSEGTTNSAGDTTSAGDTACDPIECRLDQHVNAGVCITCPLGTTNAAGDMAAGGSTACDPIECRLDQYVNAGVCVTCPEGTTNAAGDMAAGGDTACDPIALRCTTGKSPKAANKSPKAAKNSPTKKTAKKKASKKKAKKGKSNLMTHQPKLRVKRPDDGNSKSKKFTGDGPATPSTSAGNGLLAVISIVLCKTVASTAGQPAPQKLA